MKYKFKQLFWTLFYKVQFTYVGFFFADIILKEWNTECSSNQLIWDLMLEQQKEFY